MKILLTLDYELFFGTQTGSTEHSIIKPTEQLMQMAQALGIPLVFFVDVAYLLALKREMRKSPQLARDYDAVCKQIQALGHAGHEIQLHIHSHWEDCEWSSGSWQMDTRRYRLHDFPEDDIVRLCKVYSDELRNIAGPEHVFAYRAGGWVVQPFEKISAALAAVNVRIDSSVFPGGTADANEHRFDFRAAPSHGHWRFSNDPTQPDPSGQFLEVPISSTAVPPSFFWRLAWHKKLGGATARQFGDGRAIGPGKSDMLRKLSRASHSVVSMDGFKSSMLETAHRQYERAGASELVVIGHPKALSPYSMVKLQRFLTEQRCRNTVGYRPYLAELL